LHRHLIAPIVVMGLSLCAPARAGETPLYQPTPEWVVPAQLPDVTALPASAPALLIFDGQHRIAEGTLWSYVDTAQRIISSEVLNQMATLTIPWMPDKGDLIVHELAIIRDGQTIDLLADGKTFTVLRREQSLEQRELTGQLTATMDVEGLRVGDILRVRFSTTTHDQALGDHVQMVTPILTAPMAVGQGRLRTLWANDSGARWKALMPGIDARPVRRGAFTELVIDLPVAKPPEMPEDAPMRFRPVPMLEASTFTDWKDVSRTMAPLFATDELIPEGSPLAAEMAAIMQAHATPLARAQAALQLVQDKVRYLAVQMDGGNYVPQSPERTWTLRYGDCKAKTLLLLALLRGMGLEAEAVLAHAQLGDMVVNRLPSAAAFNHVLVHATVDGQSLWLDGTGMGARIEDIHDTPPFVNVLPLQPQGADLIRIEPHADGRPSLDLTMDVNESSSVDVPSVFDLTLVLRGGTATQINLLRNRLDAARQQELFATFLSRVVGDSQFGAIEAQSDEQAGLLTLKARGLSNTAWRWDDKLMKRPVDRWLGMINFGPDRARAAWSAIPVATPSPEGRRMRMRLRLPDGGRGFRIDGEPQLQQSIAGFTFNRSVTLEDGLVTLDERIDSTGAEIGTGQIGPERDRLATAKARAPRLIAPTHTRHSWDINGRDPQGGDQIATAEAILAEAIARDPTEAGPYQVRAELRRGIGNTRGALADFDKAIAIEPSVQLYLMRSAVREGEGNVAAALADAEAARQLDPSAAGAIARVAELKAEQGDLAAGLALVDERIDLGGETRDTYRQVKADLLGRFGDAQEALALVETMIEDKPGTPSLLNMRCWIKGTREVDLDNATRDCTSALELSSNPYPILDSRAMVSFRLGRYDDAMRDLDAVLKAVPTMAASRYLRGIVLARLDRQAESRTDLAIARRLDPGIDSDYRRFGIEP